jgi:two-component system alkaline phosphatase synthesis response regulator PhoP
VSGPYKILVIEDDPVLRDSIAIWLDLMGYAVVVADDGRDGLAVLSQERPDLVITDIAMPRLNGIEVIRSVRQFPSGLGDVPILVLTGSFTEFASDAISAGADRALAKPVDPKTLLSHMTNLLKPPAESRPTS